VDSALCGTIRFRPLLQAKVSTLPEFVMPIVMGPREDPRNPGACYVSDAGGATA